MAESTMEIDRPSPSCYTYSFACQRSIDFADYDGSSAKVSAACGSSISGRQLPRRRSWVFLSSMRTTSWLPSGDRYRLRPVSTLRTLVRVGTLVAVLVATLLACPLAAAQTQGTAEFETPVPDDVLRGVVQIQGTADAPGFASADLAFAYQSDETNTWFPIAEIDQPVSNGGLGPWDTSTISDGDYLLRLRVNSLAGTQLEAKVKVQVRNYTSPVLTAPSATPTEPPPVDVPTAMLVVASATPPAIAPAAPTPLPVNPAAISENAVYAGFARGALLVTALVLMAGIAILRRRG